MSTRISQRISQGASALDSRVMQTRIDRVGGPTRTATTISFTGPGTIADSGNGLGNFKVGMSIRVFGSTVNDGDYIAKTVAAGSITIETVNGVGLKTQIAGPTITITQEDK